jgi:glycosyltransferase involved in cell wall biosynthesis
MNATLPRILVVNNTCSLSAGTTRSLLLNLKYLRHKYLFDVTACPDSDGLPSALLDYEIPFHRLGFLPFASFRRLVRLMGKREYDIVYANNFSDASRDAFWAAKLTRRPFVWHIREIIRQRMYAWTVRYSDAVIANSQDTADEVSSMTGYRSPVVILNGIDPQEFDVDRAKAREVTLHDLRCPADSFVMLNVGHLSGVKNQLGAVDVAGLVAKRHPEVRLACLGAPAEPGYPERLRQRIRENDLSRKVYLRGFRSNTSEYLRGADLLLHTAMRDPPFSRAVIEAMAAGLPVVAYDVRRNSEVAIDGETALLVPSGNTDAAADAVCRLIEDSSLRTRMARAGRTRVMQGFTAEATARQVDSVIQSVLVTRGRPKTTGR